eukprot:4407742-Amphidinium_carterae.1
MPWRIDAEVCARGQFSKGYHMPSLAEARLSDLTTSCVGCWGRRTVKHRKLTRASESTFREILL